MFDYTECLKEKCENADFTDTGTWGLQSLATLSTMGWKADSGFLSCPTLLQAADGNCEAPVKDVTLGTSKISALFPGFYAPGFTVRDFCWSSCSCGACCAG